MRRINARSKDSEGNDSRLASRIVLGIEPEALIRRLGSCAGRTVSLSLYYKAADSVALSECCGRSCYWGVCRPIAMPVAPLTSCSGGYIRERL